MKKKRMQSLIVVLTFIFFTSYSTENLETTEAFCLYEDIEELGKKMTEDKEHDNNQGELVDREAKTKKNDGTGKFSSLKMIFIEGGCFQMGAHGEDKDAYHWEKPIHEICLDDYYIGEHEVTQEQWTTVMNTNPSGTIKCCNNCPVDNVSWNDVQLFIEKLNQGTHNTYRLPTEAEWEYAARGRGQPQKYAGTSNKSELAEYAWFADNTNLKPNPVKSKKPNSMGLYDMSGNLSEWVQDWYNEHYYSRSPRYNPTGPSSGSERVKRGGNWSFPSGFTRTSHRNSSTPDKKLISIGFRLSM